MMPGVLRECIPLAKAKTPLIFFKSVINPFNKFLDPDSDPYHAPPKSTHLFFVSTFPERFDHKFSRY